MITDIQYCTDAKGNKTAVIVPVKDWEKFNSRYESLQKKVRILTGVQEAVNEVKASRRHGEKLLTLTEFINESRG